jgi:allophanate hydrolase
MGEIAKRAAAARAAAQSGPPEVWITLSDEADIERAAAAVERALEGGEDLPLAGLTVAVKDNIDVAGLPTTAACPAYAYTPERHAPAVAGLVAAGAILIGKTNMDQFATGLVGTRSPYGIVRNSADPRFVSGGSSSGSAVAVALGQVDLALGTDTAGSGRVPAAFNGVVGLKPTRGLISTTGTVPACPSLDCVSIFAPTVATAQLALAAAGAADGDDPYRRVRPSAAPGPVGRLGVADPDQLKLTKEGHTMWRAALDRLAATGVAIETVDIADLLAAGELLYSGALVAERYAAIGEFVAAHPDQVDPVVRDIVLRAASVPAYRLAADLHRLAGIRRRSAHLFEAVDAVALPTTPEHPLVSYVEIDPIGVNERLGLYSHFCNPLDLCALAVPAGRTPGGLPWGITLFAPAFADGALADFARCYLGEAPLGPPARPAEARRLLVVAGAHLRGQPLNSELVALGARFVEQTTTAAVYRLYALPTDLPKPGLVRVAGQGSAIEIEIWSLDDRGFADLVAGVAAPLAIGQVETAGGGRLPGFVCLPGGLDGARDITEHGGWRRYLAAQLG